MSSPPRPTPEPSPFERHARLTLLLTVLVGCVLVDLLAGVVYREIRGYAWHERGRELYIDAERFYRIPSPIFHHALRANVRKHITRWGQWEYEVTTNGLGFRDFKTGPVPLRSDRHRLLLIGDSFTEGLGMDYADSFAGHLTQKLAEDGIEVLNASVVSYSPILYWRKIKYLLDEVGLEFDEVAVFIDISDCEDEADYYELTPDERVVLQLHPEPTGKEPARAKVMRFFRRNTILSYLLFQGIRKKLTRRPLPAGIPRGTARWPVNYRRSLWTIDPAAFEEYGRRGLARMDAYMDRLADLLREHGIGLIVAVYPWPDQIVHGDLDSIQATHWQAWCARQGAAFLDYFPYFIHANQTPEEAIRTLEENYIPGDVHWNVQGHRLVADVFLDFYRESALKSQHKQKGE